MKFNHPGKEIFIKKSVLSASPSETLESRQNVNDAFCSGTPALQRCPDIWQKFYRIHFDKFGENYSALAL